MTIKVDEFCNKICNADSISFLKTVPSDSFHLILSDIPYGISIDKWDVLHSNTNSALLGSSPAQEKAGAVFKTRGKPLNGWSEADRLIPKEYYDWVLSWAGDCYRILKPGASLIIFAGRRLSHRAVCAFEDSGFTYKDMIAWVKDRAAHRAQRISVVFERRNDFESAKIWSGWKVGNLRPTFEPILWFTKPYKIGGTIADNLVENKVGGYDENVFKMHKIDPDNIVNFLSLKSDSGLHPTQKPLALMKLLVEMVTKEGQLVLDPFCGSGTTLIAASQLNRRFLGVEKSFEYYEICKKRFASQTKNLFDGTCSI